MSWLSYKLCSKKKSHKERAKLICFTIKRTKKIRDKFNKKSNKERSAKLSSSKKTFK
jgi:hypothetical protein